MEDFPRTLVDFEKRFSTEEACRRYLSEIRWPSGFRCPRCAFEAAWTSRRELMRCQKCDFQVSVTSGTIFHRSRLPLTAWFRAIWWVLNQKSGVSALGLQRLLGLGSYRTAWMWLHKLRRAMVRPGRDALDGTVEVDETFVGGVDAGGGRRHLGNKALVVIAAQADGKGIGRIRLRQVGDASAETLTPFVKDVVAPGSTVVTDGFSSYPALKDVGFKHKPRVVSTSTKTASTLLPRVHRVASLLKRWLLGTHQGAVSREHLAFYLDEFTFRFNRRRSVSRGKLFYRLVQQAVRVDPTPYAKMVGGKPL